MNYNRLILRLFVCVDYIGIFEVYIVDKYEFTTFKFVALLVAAL